MYMNPKSLIIIKYYEKSKFLLTKTRFKINLFVYLINCLAFVYFNKWNCVGYLARGALRLFEVGQQIRKKEVFEAKMRFQILWKISLLVFAYNWGVFEGSLTLQWPTLCT